jgi:lysophospholipase L1-like esterase
MTGRWPKAALFLLYLFALLEVGSRVYWRLEYDIPVFGGGPFAWHGTFYKNFRNPDFKNAPPQPGNEVLDVLLLGGSVLNDLYKQRADELDQALERATGRPVRLFNFARAGHTTRDSALKYRVLSELPFELVIVYNGINDARHNNVSPDGFRADYTHAAWYARVETMRSAAPWDAWSRVPYLVRYLWMRVLEAIPGLYMPRNTPIPEWTRFGDDLKSVDAFRANLEEIRDIARERGHALLVPTFAWYLPDGYSLEAFQAHELDYTGHAFPVEIWGEPENVAAALDAHNDIIRGLATARDFPSVDLESALPKQGSFFTDICHLTEAGERRWIERVAPAAADAL